MLQLKNISKSYNTGTFIQKALDNVSLNFRDNEFVSILGPSGSGKSTLLNIIGGLDQYDSGDLVIDFVSTKKYKDRDWDSYRNHTVGFIFQSYNLIGHQSVLANVELALTISGISKDKKRKLALEALEKVGLKDHAHKKPNQLSGGQMQRVAIARALVNNPSIVLADEPTGALDSATSVQVMDLLKEVAKDRLVVMVTHNPELAQDYSTRIVTLQDGKITSDSDPYEIKSEKEAIHKNFGKSSMSLLTSIGLSFNNLKTKFKRTFMVAIAGSIGIIGISLILGLSNGVNKFISDTEEETMLSYPIEIQNSSISMTSTLSVTEKKNDEGDIGELETLENILSSVSQNDLASLRNYFENEGDKIYDYSKAIEYKYDIEPIIYTLENNKYVKVNPNESFSSLGLSSNNILFSNSSINAFSKLPKEDQLYKSKYTLKSGNWPNNENECIVVTDVDGNLSDFVFYSLGLRDNEQLSKMIEKFANNEKVDIESNKKNWKYEDIIGREFKAISSSSLYNYDEKNGVYVNISENQDMVEDVINKKGINLKIVGIASPNSSNDMTTLRMGIWYQDELVTDLRNIAKRSDVVLAQMANPNKNILTNDDFGKKTDSNIDFRNMFSIDEGKLAGAFNIDSSKINIDTSSIANMDLNKYNFNIDSSTMINPDFLKNINIKVDNEKLKKMVTDLTTNYLNYASKDKSTNYVKLPEGISSYINSDEGKEILSKYITKIIMDNKDSYITNEMITEITKEVMSSYTEFARKNGYIDPTKFDKYLSEYLKTESAKEIISKQTEKVLNHIISNTKLNNDDVKNLAIALSNGYIEYAKKNNLPDPSKFEDSLNSYLQTEQAKQDIENGIYNAVNVKEIEEQIKNESNSMNKNAESLMKQTLASITNDIALNIKNVLTNTMSQLPNAIMIDTEKFTSAFVINTSKEEMEAFMSAMVNNSKSSYSNNLKTFGYAKDSDVTKISIYPKDFETKKQAISFLDDYNKKMDEKGETDKTISYTDLVGVMLSSITTIINVISYVLIAFVAISLVVSSIMIGVITYISVLERKKEIGILRAIGASKKNISQVFNSETGIIGLFAGVLGIIITILLFIPTNLILRKVTDIDSLTAYLTFPQAITLILISVILTLIGGLIPSKSAAKQDPVEALRVD